MKKTITLFALVLLGLTSCKKEELLVEVDVIENQGGDWANVGGTDFKSGMKRVERHIGKTWGIKCYSDDCRININGAVYTKSGVYYNDLQTWTTAK